MRTGQRGEEGQDLWEWMKRQPWRCDRQGGEGRGTQDKMKKQMTRWPLGQIPLASLRRDRGEPTLMQFLSIETGFSYTHSVHLPIIAHTGRPQGTIPYGTTVASSSPKNIEPKGYPMAEHHQLLLIKKELAPTKSPDYWVTRQALKSNQPTNRSAIESSPLITGLK